jgi:hypothetical protein
VKRSGPPLVASRGTHLLGLSLSGGELHHQDPLHLECRLALWRCVWLNHGSGWLAGELASPWRCLLLDGALLSASLHLLPSVTSMTSPKREAGAFSIRGVVVTGVSGAPVSHPVLKPKPDAHRMYAQDQVVIHMARM